MKEGEKKAGGPGFAMKYETARGDRGRVPLTAPVRDMAEFEAWRLAAEFERVGKPLRSWRVERAPRGETPPAGSEQWKLKGND